MNSLSARPAVCVSAANSHCKDKAIAVAHQTGIALCADNSDCRIYLLVTPERLELHDATRPGAIYVDFVGGSLGHRRQYGGGRKQPLARAVGIKAGVMPSIFDATAGLGKDAFVLASLGCQVTLCERSPVLAALIHDGLERALAHPGTQEIAQRMRLINDDAVEQIQHLPEGKHTLYLDPMYPEKKKSALVKKEMQMLQMLIGPDLDSGDLLTMALTHNTGRVVVKRPLQSAFLNNVEPTVSISSKKTRYDIYVAAACTPE